MAVGHIKLTPSASHTVYIQVAMNQLRDGKRKLSEVIAFLSQMIDGDISIEENFSYMATALGTDNANAKAAFDELSSLHFKLTTNVSINDMHSAMDQAVARLYT